MRKKYEYCFDNESLFGIKKVLTLGTVYKIIKNSFECKIELYNLVYDPRSGNFYTNGNVHLPIEIKNYFLGRYPSEKVMDRLRELKICSIDDVMELIEEYDDFNIKKELVKQKIFTLSSKCKNN